MAKVSAALRQRLMDQRKGMQSGGMLIKNKDVRRLRLRILPPGEGQVPGVENISFYSKPLNKGSTSPLCWGVPCPVNDALDRIYREGSKDDKDAAKEFCRRNVEYWIPVIDRADEGSPNNPKVRILAAKTSIYQTLTDWMLDEDEDEEDVTDPIEGRDVVVKKKGTGLDTSWSIERVERCPISEDEDMANAWVELASKFDVRSRFYAPNLEVLDKMYEGLTGESIPKEYRDAIKALIKTLEAGGQVDPAAEDDAPEVDADAEGSEEEEAAEEEEAEGLTGKTVQFDNDGTTVQGVVKGPDEEDAGNWLVAEDGADEDESPWSIPESLLTVVELEEAEEEEAEEVPAPSKKTIVKKPQPKAAPAKPAATPRKPGAAPKASASIKSRLKGGPKTKK